MSDTKQQLKDILSRIVVAQLGVIVYGVASVINLVALGLYFITPAAVFVSFLLPAISLTITGHYMLSSLDRLWKYQAVRDLVLIKMSYGE